ncbi:MAG: phytanoyl-CoA dioxygenase family protein [Casimicrobiaceae bacterium]
MTGWDHPDTVRYYEAFNRRHTRYRTANSALVRHAQLRPGLRVLDFAAGTGGTAAAALDILGADGRVDCVEPAQAMRAAGMQKFDARVRWFADLESTGTGYERILCGAAIWQVPDVAACIQALAERLAPGGALCFNIPAAYAGEPDPPGRGADPFLTELAGALARLRAGGESPAAAQVTLASRKDLQAALSACGLVPCSWRFASRLTQRAYRDWLKIPVLTDRLLGSLDADQRAAAIDAAAGCADPASWRTERWLGWTAWRPPFALGLLRDASAERRDPARLRHRALREGYVFLPRLLPRAAVMALRRQAITICRELGLLDGRDRWCGGRFGDGSGTAAYTDARWLRLQQRLFSQPECTELGNHPALRSVVAHILEAAPVSGQGSVCRLAPPSLHQAPTAMHRDYQYLPGSTRLWTAWLPLGDCPLELGPLAVSPRSEQQDSAADVPWVSAAMRAGDVLLVNVLTLHRACPNFTRDSVRLSLDFRYVHPGDVAGPA